MNTEPTIHVMPTAGTWKVMTDDQSCLIEGLTTREEAIRCAGKVAAERRCSFMVIHSEEKNKNLELLH